MASAGSVTSRRGRIGRYLGVLVTGLVVVFSISVGALGGLLVSVAVVVALGSWGDR